MVKENVMKQTEIGLIPEDWEVKELGGEIELRKRKFNPLTASEIRRCIELENIVPETGRIVGENYTDSVVSLKTIFYENDILFGKLRPYLRKYANPDFSGVCTSEIWVLSSNQNWNQFFFYVFQTEKIIEVANQSTGTKMPRAEWSVVSKTKIPLPPLPEQHAIAEALSDADSWIESLEKLIAKKRLIKQGAMQELLTPKEDWEVVKLDGNFTLKARIGWQGLTTDEYLKTGDYSLVTGTDFKNGFIDWDNCVFVEKVRYDQDRNIQLRNNDVLVTKDGTIGKVAYINRLPKPTTLNSGVFVVRPIRNFDNQFLYYILMSEHFDRFLCKITAGSTIVHLYQKDFIHFEFPCPVEIGEQTRIATILSDMDAELEKLEAQLAKARQVKQGMMQELLTGRVRLV